MGLFSRPMPGSPNAPVPAWQDAKGAGDGGACCGPTTKACLKETAEPFMPCVIAVVMLVVIFVWRAIELGVDWVAAVPFAYPVALFVPLRLALRHRRCFTVVVCLNSFLLACYISWSLDELVTHTTERWSADLEHVVKGFVASGAAPFAAGATERVTGALIQETVWHNPMSSTLAFPFAVLLNLSIAFSHVFQFVIGMKFTDPFGDHCGAHVVWCLLNPILNNLVLMVMMLLSSNYYNLKLWCPLVAAAALVMAGGSLHARKLGRRLHSTTEVRLCAFPPPVMDWTGSDALVPAAGSGPRHGRSGHCSTQQDVP